MASRGSQRKTWVNRSRKQWAPAPAPMPEEEVEEVWETYEEAEEGETGASSWGSDAKQIETDSYDQDWGEGGDWHQSETSSDSWHRGWQWDPQWGWYKLWVDEDSWSAPRVEETTLADDGRWHGRGTQCSNGTSSTRDEDWSEHRGRPTEKMSVPEFNGEGTEADLGQSARSYLRRVQAWLKVTKMPERERPIALYSHLTGRAWVAAEELSVDRLSGSDGIQYFMDWVRICFMEIEITKVANVMMSELFRKCRKRADQPVREFNLEYERLLLRLRELECELPPLVKAWLYMDKLKMSEVEEMNLLSSVNNKFDLKLLQQAALIHDRTIRKKSDKRWGRQSVHVTANGEEDSEDEPLPGDGAQAEESDDDIVTEEVALTYHEAYVAFQDAKSRYKEALKGRGADPAELKKRAEARLALAKARSYCGACKRKGHWHKDPECPLRQGGGQAPKESPVKNVQLCHVYAVESMENKQAEEVMAVRPQGCSSLHAIADTACSKTVAGHQWFQDYCHMADLRGIPVEVVNESEKFKFGASRVHTSTFSVWARFSIAQRCFAVKVAVVPCKVPLLFSRTVLAKLQMTYHCGEHRADFKTLGIEGMSLGLSEMGHPTLAVADFDDSTVPAVPIEDGFWGKDPDVRVPADGEVYMCAPPLKPLFYPKKVSPTVQNMLESKNMPKVAFYKWWKDAKLSKDFWIETEDEIVRIHVVPRGCLFDPLSWKTSLHGLKEELIASLDGHRVTEALPVVGMDTLLHVQEDCDWKHGRELQVGKHLGPWIGRSRFSWHGSKLVTKRLPSADAPHSPSFDLAMGNEEAPACGGASGIGGSGAPQVDGSRTSCHSGGAKSHPESQGGEHRHEGHLTNDAAGIDQEVRGSQFDNAREANPRSFDTAPKGLVADCGRPCPHIREAEELDVQGDSRGLHDLGGEGDKSQSQLLAGADALCNMGGTGAGKASRGVQEAVQDRFSSRGCGGQGSDRSPRTRCPGVGFDGLLGPAKVNGGKEDFFYAKAKAVQPRLKGTPSKRAPITVEDEESDIPDSPRLIFFNRNIEKKGKFNSDWKTRNFQ